VLQVAGSLGYYQQFVKVLVAVFAAQANQALDYLEMVKSKNKNTAAELFRTRSLYTTWCAADLLF
jgi:hypothetical protein